MSTTFALTSDQLVNAALRKLAVLGDGQSPSSTQLANGTIALNAMLKGFASKGMPLWAITEQPISLTNSQDYPLTTNAPLKVIQAILVNNTAGNMIPLNLKTHYDFNLLNTSYAPGTPVHYWYEPLNQSGILHVWPTPDAYNIANCVIKITYQRPFNDMVGGADALDFPQNWQEAVIYGLAHRLSAEYGIPLQDRQLLASEAKMFLDEALAFGTEEGSLFIQPDWAAQQ